MAFTDTSSMAGLVKTAYDRYVEFALRDTPMIRAVADKRPVQQAMPGSSVVFSLYNDLAAATAAASASAAACWSAAASAATSISAISASVSSIIEVTPVVQLTSTRVGFAICFSLVVMSF